MCAILFNRPQLDWEKVKTARDLIFKNLFDYKEFHPLINMALNDRLLNLENDCKLNGNDIF
jgi:hypothetical protein